MKFKIKDTINKPSLWGETEDIRIAELMFEKAVNEARRKRVLLTKEVKWYSNWKKVILRNWAMYAPWQDTDADFKSWNVCELCGDAIQETHWFCMRCKQVI